MTDYFEYDPENPPPEHIARQWVPRGEWVEVPGFDEVHTLQVMHEHVEEKRLQLLLVQPGKITWYTTVPARWFCKVDDDEPQDHSGGDGLKMVWGDEPEGHAHGGPEPCPACAEEGSVA